MGEAVFTIARNPQEDSKLPYLLRLPIEGGLILKARDTWPRATRIHCHAFEEDWPDPAEIVEEIPIASCRRRGAVIDLVLDRARFPLAVRLHRDPRAPGDLLADPEGGQGREPRSQDPACPRGPRGLSNRDRYPRALPVPVRRQGCFDRTGCAFGRRLRGGSRGRPYRDGRAKDPREPRLVAFRRNSSVPDAAAFGDAIGCRGRRGTYSALFKLEHISGAWLADMLARLHVRYPEVQVAFADSRKFAEEWTYRFLAAALADSIGPDVAK